MGKIKVFLGRMKQTWLGYHPYIRWLLIIMLLASFTCGILGSMGIIENGWAGG